MEIECQDQGEPQIGEIEPELIEDEQHVDRPETDEALAEVEEATVESLDPLTSSDNVAVNEEATKDEEETKSDAVETKPVVKVPALPPAIEQEIGHMSGAYPCTNNHIQGTFYAGSNGFAFTGTLFFYTSRFSHKWEKVSHVHHSEMGHIIIQVNDDEKDFAYTFASIQQSEIVWATLSALHSECNKGTPQKHPLLTPMRASLRRLSTDPTSMRPHIDHEIGNEEAYVAAATAAAMDDLRLSMSSRRMSVAPPEEPTSDLEEAWGYLHGNPGESYKENAFDKQQIPCSLEKFFELFLSDDAVYSIPNFMAGEGDFNVVTSHWKATETKGSKSRTIEYSHPINAPLAPPNAKARKEQRLRRFLNQGISIETDTYVDDVPMTDCFYVTDRILVSANDDGTVTVAAYFDIRFVKSTMFRSIIANTTRSEFVKWFQNLLNMLRREATALAAPPSEVPAEPCQPSTSEPPIEAVLQYAPVLSDKKASIGLIHVLAILITFVLVLQVYILNYLSRIETTLIKIQAQQADVCVLPQIVRNAVLNGQECEEVIAASAAK
ncbi:protein of unknown function (DUF4782) [Fragilaria crotonensis]|nr:protein of unknown function (DUF4782) [Fragilaria crotonensis]